MAKNYEYNWLAYYTKSLHMLFRFSTRSKINYLRNEFRKAIEKEGLRDRVESLLVCTDLKISDESLRSRSELDPELNTEHRRLAEAIMDAFYKERDKLEQLSFQANIKKKVEDHKAVTHENLVANESYIHSNKEYDVFICHSSSDKEDLVRPLAHELKNLGVTVWFDEFELEIGDSLRRSIDYGLANSRYGLIVLSASFFMRNWTQYELDGFVNREMNGLKVILPIWHKVSKDEVSEFSPSLADRIALNTSLYGVSDIAKEISLLVNANN